MGMFDRSLKIDSGKKYDTSEVSSEGISKEERAEIEKKNRKMIDIFKAFDVDKSGDLSSLELANALKAFSQLDSDGNKKLSKKEFEEGAKMFNDAFASMGIENIEGKDLKAFMKYVRKATKDDSKVSTDKVIDDYNKSVEEARVKAEAEAKAKAEAEAKAAAEAKAKAEAEAAAEKERLRLQTPKDYTVQPGETLDSILKRSLEAQGIEVNEENLKKAKEEFIKNNPGAVHGKQGKEYLYMGDVVKVPGDLEDKGNADAIKDNYRAQQLKKRQAAERAKYTVDAFYRNKDGSEGRHIKLKPTGEKAANGRFYAVDQHGNRYLVAHDGTLLDSQKVAKKDAAVAKNKKMATSRQQYNNLVKSFNAAMKSFNHQVAKDGWAANTADAVSGFFGSTNTEDHVRADLNAYKGKLKELKAALDRGDKAKFDQLYKELSKNDITSRVEKYNQSQEKGGAVVKGVAVGVVSGVAAVATGGASLAVTAAVAGGSTFVASVAAETTDLATNQIDGDVNAENMGKIAKKASTDALIAGATAGLFKGVGNMFSKSASTATRAGAASAADDAAGAGTRAGTGAAGAADDAAGAGTRAGTGAASAADDAAGAGTRTGTSAAGAGTRSSTSGSFDWVRNNSQAFDDIVDKVNYGGVDALDSSQLKILSELLDISEDALKNMTKKTYKSLTLKFHPDRHGGDEAAQKIFQLIGNIFRNSR